MAVHPSTNHRRASKRSLIESTSTCSHSRLNFSCGGGASFFALEILFEFLTNVVPVFNPQQKIKTNCVRGVVCTWTLVRDEFKSTEKRQKCDFLGDFVAQPGQRHLIGGRFRGENLARRQLRTSGSAVNWNRLANR